MCLITFKYSTLLSTSSHINNANGEYLRQNGSIFMARSKLFERISDTRSQHEIACKIVCQNPELGISVAELPPPLDHFVAQSEDEVPVLAMYLAETSQTFNNHIIVIEKRMKEIGLGLHVDNHAGLQSVKLRDNIIRKPGCRWVAVDLMNNRYPNDNFEQTKQICLSFDNNILASSEILTLLIYYPSLAFELNSEKIDSLILAGYELGHKPKIANHYAPSISRCYYLNDNVEISSTNIGAYGHRFNGPRVRNIEVN